MNSVGFDLGSSSLKLIEASKEGEKFHVVSSFEYANPFGLMFPPDNEQMQQMATMVKQILTEHKVSTRNIRAALPESMVSTKIVTTPTLTDAELASAIDWLAEQHIAIPLEELKVEYEVLYRPPREKKEENMRVMLIGVPKRVIEQYVKFFEMLEIEPVVMETQVLSIIRALIQEQMPTTLIIHMGASATDFIIIHEQEIVFVYSFPNGGRLFTRAIEKGLNLDSTQAEEYKRSYGVDPQFLEGRLAKIVEPVMRLFIVEIEKAMQYFTSQFGTLTVKRILLSGGCAHMPGIEAMLAANTGVEVIVSNPFMHFVQDLKTPLPMDRQASFTVATGLVIREM